MAVLVLHASHENSDPLNLQLEDAGKQAIIWGIPECSQAHYAALVGMPSKRLWLLSKPEVAAASAA